MKRSLIITTALLAALTMSARSAKRGVSENEFQFKAQMAAIAPGVSWFYNWGNTVGRYLEKETAMEFVPMCWNGSYNADNIRTYCKAHPEVKYLLGFNEPNFTNQANMTPAEAAAKWPEVQALAKELGLELVAPALNYSPNPPYQDPLKWMDEFVALVGLDAFDYLAVHSYGGFGVMKTIATNFHERYGNKPVWVTEFCLWPDEGNPNSYVSPDSQISSMIQSVEWLEKTDWIYRYAWFKAIGNSSSDKGPNYGLLLSGKAENERQLSDQGLVYLNITDFDTEVYNDVNTTVAATDYISQSNCVLGRGNNPACPRPIEVTQFSAGATLDYQFDVPSAGEYNLVLTVTGYGEPSRFDPYISICTVNADGTNGDTLADARPIALPNSDTEYINERFAVTLPAGRQTLRIVDNQPSQPSGIRISTVMLAEAASVTELTDDADSFVNVYSTQGMLLRGPILRSEATAGLPAGLYIVDGIKVLIK